MTWIEEEQDNQVLIMADPVVRYRGMHSRTEVHRSPDILPNWADFPTASYCDSGAMMLAWLERTPESGGYGIQFMLMGSLFSGVFPPPIGPHSLHDHVGEAEHGFVSLAPNGPDSFLSVWLDGRHAGAHGHDEGAYVLMSRTIRTDGTLGPEVVVDDQVCSCCQTDLVRLEDGTHIVVYRDCSDENVRDIAWAHRTSEGWSTPQILYDDGWVIPGCPVNGPRAVDDAIVWYTGTGDAGGEVKFVEFHADEGALFEPLDVDDGHPLGRVDIVKLESGTRIVTWLENVGDGEAEWRARPVNARGEMGPSTVIDRVPATREVGFLRAVATSEGAVFTWFVPGRGVQTGLWVE
tara:strand:+ start:21136 stop:22182 length:1047 start_codon:yes stop_codon:yes gene_type:complete